MGPTEAEAPNSSADGPVRVPAKASTVPAPPPGEMGSHRIRGGAGESALRRRSALTISDATEATVAVPTRTAFQPSPYHTIGTKAIAATHCPRNSNCAHLTGAHTQSR